MSAGIDFEGEGLVIADDRFFRHVEMLVKRIGYCESETRTSSELPLPASSRATCSERVSLASTRREGETLSFKLVAVRLSWRL